MRFLSTSQLLVLLELSVLQVVPEREGGGRGEERRRGGEGEMSVTNTQIQWQSDHKAGYEKTWHPVISV